MNSVYKLAIIDQVKILLRAIGDNDHYRSQDREALIQLALEDLDKLKVLVEQE
jgi:hypothetical protein